MTMTIDIKVNAVFALGWLLVSVGTQAADGISPEAYRRIITLQSPAGQTRIVVPPVQRLEYFALHEAHNGDVLELQGNVVIAVVENGHAQMTLTSQQASITRTPIDPAEAAAIADLESMRLLDQKYRSKQALTNDDMERQGELDKSNTKRLREIVERFGWPVYSFGGMVAADSAFLILQHCDDLALQERYLPMLRSAAHDGQASVASLALLEDRIRLRKGMPQIYGSQLRSLSPPEPEPIEDATHVDERRAAVGLEPLSAYLRRFEGDSLPATSAR